MREYEHRLDKELIKGLKPYSNRPRNSEGLIECFNVVPYEEGVMSHTEVISPNDATKAWGATMVLPTNTTTRDITIHVTDLVSTGDVSGAMVYLDGVLEGTADANGEVTILGVSLGGHSVKITAAGYLDSDTDALFNDYIVVT